MVGRAAGARSAGQAGSRRAERAAGGGRGQARLLAVDDVAGRATAMAHVRQLQADRKRLADRFRPKLEPKRPRCRATSRAAHAPARAAPCAARVPRTRCACGRLDQLREELDERQRADKRTPRRIEAPPSPAPPPAHGWPAPPLRATAGAARRCMCNGRA